MSVRSDASGRPRSATRASRLYLRVAVRQHLVPPLPGGRAADGCQTGGARSLLRQRFGVAVPESKACGSVDPARGQDYNAGVDTPADGAAKKPSEGVRRAARRRFLKRAALVTAGLLGGGAVWSLETETRGLVVRRVAVRLPDLPAALDGFTIGQLSDLHAGVLVCEERIRGAAEMAVSLRPDLIALTGDYVWGGAGNAETCARALSILEAPHGVYGVLGNHDYWTGDVARVTGALTGVGVKMLINDSARLDVAGTAWWLCGVDDVWSGKPDLERFSTAVPEQAFRLLLCHEPDYADTAAEHGIPLQLSGHSHGGQVRLPLLGAPVLPYLGRKYPIGLQRAEASTLVYTNVGVGVTAPPVRLNCRPEVTHLTLRRA